MKARRRDRRVYLASHPILFGALALARRRPVMRLGRTVLVNDASVYRHVLTSVPLDRAAPGTTGGAARSLGGGSVLFDQDGDAHRRSRRSFGALLSSHGVDGLRAQWTSLLDSRLAPLAAGGTVDMVSLAAELSGWTACALLDLPAQPLAVARAALDAGAAGARTHLPGMRRIGSAAAARRATDRLLALTGDPMAAMLAVAAVNTTVAGIPRAVAWCADAQLWLAASEDAPTLADELLRVTAPTPLLPRVAAAPGTAGSFRVRTGDRLLLLARHAVGSYRDDPSVTHPAPAHISQLAFGAGPHACPGARLARTQLIDVLQALAPYRPVIVRARADRHSALPGWKSLIIQAGR